MLGVFRYNWILRYIEINKREIFEKSKLIEL
jgi:hypothetical protein